jgi:hypothetical protein
MGKINIGRVILGGIVAGIIADLLGYVIDGILLASEWAAGQKNLGHADFVPNQLIIFNLLGVASAVGIIWVYAAIRPRFGAGVKTAIIAALTVWGVGFVIPNLALMYATGLYPLHLTILTTTGGLIECLTGGIAGAALYKE